MNEPIAIIGIGCRFPGGVNSPETLWQLLVDGKNVVSEIPPNRFDVDAYFDETPATPGKIMSRWGGYLDDIDRFDASFFGISPREAERMDPQQRILLEVAWEALEDAGQVPNTDDIRQTGVFVGLWLNDFESWLFKDPAAADFYMTTGSGRYSASGRLSYVLGLQGPSMTVDSACSSSLVAVHLACQSLRSGECDMALAGGANVILQPQITIAYSQSKMMAPDGRCKFGDASADGYVRSEGAGVIVLKRLSQAVAEGDPIYAIIRGSAVNNDGRTSGYLATPGSAGQEEMLRKAYANAGVSPGTVQYVEAHGTGTNVGDPVEIGALGSVLRVDRPAGQVCELGSIKTNFGHAEGAAGMAGLIKVALSLRNNMLPASLHFHQPNPNIPWEELKVRVHTALTPWPQHTGPAIGGVSSFGIAGTNAHIVLQEAPIIEPHSSIMNESTVLLPLSAHSPAALTALAHMYEGFLTSEQGRTVALNDLAYTTSVRRSHHEYRLAVAGQSPDEVAEQLKLFVAGEDSRVKTGRKENETAPRVVFVFPGQGGQWAGMARELMQSQPVFRLALEKCEVAISAVAHWSLLEMLDTPDQDPRWEQIDTVQPLLFAVQVALAALWRSWGVEPDAILGHSLGEVTGAFVAGVLSLEDAAKVIVYRSQLMRRTSGQGAMAVVGLSLDETAKLLNGYESQLSIAVSNSPRSTVISGDPTALEAVLEKLRAQNIFSRLVKVDVASHSPQMEPLRPELVKSLADLKPHLGHIPIYSTVDNGVLDGMTMSPDYWGRNLRQPVLFSNMVERLLGDGYTLFIELSPHPILLSPIEDNFHHTGKKGHVVPSLVRKSNETMSMLNGLGAVYAVGVNVDWQQLYSTTMNVIHTPPYPWQREHYWLETAAPLSNWSGGHPLLGQRLPDLAQLPDTAIWENRTNSQFWRLMREQFSGASELLYQAIITAAVGEIYANSGQRLESFMAHETLIESTELTLQATLMGKDTNRAEIQIYGRVNEHSAWALKASGSVEIDPVQTDWLYEMTWISRNPPTPKLPVKTGRWIIFSDRSGIGAKMGLLVAQRGGSYTAVFAGEQYQVSANGDYTVDPNRPEDFVRLLKDVIGETESTVQGILYLWILDLAPTDRLDARALETAQLMSAYSPLYLVQSLAAQHWASYPRLWLVTQTAQSVLAADASVLAIAQTPLLGFGRSVAGEHPELWGGLVDLPLSGNMNEVVERLLIEMLNSDLNEEVALREGQRYVARLVRSHDLVPESAALNLRSDATYLITGGLGGVGLEVAKGLVKQGARHLVLMGRRGATEEAQSVIRELEAMSAQVMVAAADVTELADMTRVLAEVERVMPPLRGIFHAAGVIDDGVLIQQDAVRFQRAMAPKISGTWNLHTLTQDIPLDYFVLFSSVSAILGLGGQGNYAAANTFMDSFAYYRRSMGQAALTINWGVWDELGLAAGLGAYFKSVGLEGMKANNAIATMHYLLRTSAVHNLIASVKWETLLEIKGKGQSSGLYADIRQELTPENDALMSSEISVLEQLRELPATKQWDQLLAHIREKAAIVLGFDAKTLDIRAGFFKIGMDSLMSVQLRNRLQTSLNSSLPPTIALEYPTVEGLTRFIYDEVFHLGLLPALGVEPEIETASTQLDTLSEDELASLLDDELAAIDDLIGDD